MDGEDGKLGSGDGAEWERQKEMFRDTGTEKQRPYKKRTNSRW